MCRSSSAITKLRQLKAICKSDITLTNHCGLLCSVMDFITTQTAMIRGCRVIWTHIFGSVVDNSLVETGCLRIQGKHHLGGRRGVHKATWKQGVLRICSIRDSSYECRALLKHEAFTDAAGCGPAATSQKLIIPDAPLTQAPTCALQTVFRMQTCGTVLQVGQFMNTTIS